MSSCTGRWGHHKRSLAFVNEVEARCESRGLTRISVGKPGAAELAVLFEKGNVAVVVPSLKRRAETDG